MIKYLSEGKAKNKPNLEYISKRPHKTLMKYLPNHLKRLQENLPPLEAKYRECAVDNFLKSNVRQFLQMSP